MPSPETVPYAHSYQLFGSSLKLCQPLSHTAAGFAAVSWIQVTERSSPSCGKPPKRRSQVGIQVGGWRGTSDTAFTLRTSDALSGDNVHPRGMSNSIRCPCLSRGGVT